MRRTVMLALALLAAGLVFPGAGALPVTVAPATAHAAAPLTGAATAAPSAARRGFGFRRRATSPRSRGFGRPRPARRPSHLGRTIMRALGIAFLLHLLFGLGPGGGGLLNLVLLAVIVALLVSILRRMRPRRRQDYAW